MNSQTMNTSRQESDSVNGITQQTDPVIRELYTHPTRVFHLLFLILFLVMLPLGIMIHAGSRPGWSLLGEQYPSWLPTGRWGFWHLLGGTLLLSTFLSGLAYYLYQIRSFPRPSGRAFWHWLLWMALGIMCLSGLFLLNDWGPAGFYRFWRYVHLFVGVILLPVVLIGHVCKGWALGWRFWLRCFDPVGRPRLAVLLSLFVPGLAAGFFLTMGNSVTPNPRRVLQVSRVNEVPADLWSFDWNSLRPLRIRLTNGTGFRGGVTEMRLRAIHDGKEIFVRADWDDAAEQHQLYPWRRTADGWKRQEDSIEDYEDKMSILFPIKPSSRFDRTGCAYSCHLGGGREYGFKSTDVLMDVWHWKTARTQTVGQVDDKYWTTGDSSKPGPVGRKGDPETGGGYESNTVKGENHPAFLPDPAGEPPPPGVILKRLAVPYSPEAAANIAVGTIVPGIVTAPFEGDRGDVTSLARHSEGQWHLIIRRKLATGSSYDTQFEPGKSYSFAAAAFDHARFRHAYHYGTYRLELDP